MITLLTGNSRVLLAVDEVGNWTYLYYPYPGQFQHLRQSSLGLFDQDAGTFTWVGHHGWRTHQRHAESCNVGLTEHEGWGVRLALEDMVHPDLDVVIRRMRIKDLQDRPRRLRLFAYQSFNIAESMYQDTCYWDAEQRSIVHYKRNYYFQLWGEPSFSGFTCGEHTLKGLQGSYVDAEDGKLEGSQISHGAADSVGQWDIVLPQGREAGLALLLAVGQSRRQIRQLHDGLCEPVEARERETVEFWQSWMEGKEVFVSPDLSPRARDLYLRSLLVLRNCSGPNGSIIASPDFAPLRSGGDTYNYNWWRDSSYTSMAMDDVGLREGAHRFLEFAKACQEEEGYWLHRHFPDGSLGSTWHPPPFLQVDQTASVVAATWHHFARHGDMDHLLERWSMVKRAAAFLEGFVDPNTGLVAPSYDLWEERRAIHTYSCAAVVDALSKAELIAHRLGKRNGTWGERAQALKVAMLEHLWDSSAGCFVKSLQPLDRTIDASTLMTLPLGVLDATDPRAEALVDAVTQALWSAGRGGLARYQGDRYCGHENPWVICTLWLAEAKLLLGRPQEALQLLEWAARAATPTLLLPEQIDPRSGRPASVVPLVWSHATFLQAANLYKQHVVELGVPSPTEVLASDTP